MVQRMPRLCSRRGVAPRADLERELVFCLPKTPQQARDDFPHAPGNDGAQKLAASALVRLAWGRHEDAGRVLAR